MEEAPPSARPKHRAVLVNLLRWLLTILAVICVAGVVTVGFYIVYPCNIDVAPSAAARKTLIFPFRALAVAAVASLLACAACRIRARLATACYLLVVALATATLGFSLKIWPLAAEHEVEFSLISHLRLQKNTGEPPARVSRDVVYGHVANGAELVLDVWPATTPAQQTLRPAFIRLHGGAWVHGSKGDLPNWNGWLNDLGYVVFDVEYRMRPPERWKEEIGDVKCALGWVYLNAGKYGVDPARISLTGFSAGAHLAMLAAYSADSPQIPASCSVPGVQVKSVVNLYGFYDLAAAYDNSPSKAYLREALQRYVGGPPAQFPDRYRALSPATHLSANAPPTITLMGLSDRVVAAEQVRGLDRALEKAGVAHQTYLLPGADHGFDENWGSASTEFARQMVKRFLEKYG